VTTRKLPEAEWRIRNVQAIMAAFRSALRLPEFASVHAGRWRHQSGVELETGYVHGEGTVRLYHPSNPSKPYRTWKFTGRDDSEEFKDASGRFQVLTDRYHRPSDYITA